MTSPWFWVLVSTLVLVAGRVIRPTHAQCPVFWHNNGIRPSGTFGCTRNPVGDPEWDGTYQRQPDRSVVPPGEIDGQIYCTGGTHPIVVDDRTVGCQR